MEFGLWGNCPEDVKVAWGARGIIDGRWPDQRVSLLWDRQSGKGTTEARKALTTMLNAGLLQQALDRATSLLKTCDMATNEAQDFTLAEVGGIRIVGNTNGSCGYLYLIAYPTEGSEL